MAIAFGTGGAVATGTTSLSVAYPTSISSGDLLLLFITNKYPSNGPSTPTGFTFLAQASGGTGAAGANSGSVFSTVYYRIADGTETGSLAVTITSGNSSLGTIKRYTKSATMSWGIASAVASRNTGNTTAWTETFTTDPGVRTSDFTITLTGVNASATTYTLEALSQTGVTYGTMTERQDTAGSNGDGVHIVITEQSASSGTSSAAPTYAMTASTSSTSAPAGSSVLVRLREIHNAAVTQTLGNVTVSAAGTVATHGALTQTVTTSVSAATAVKVKGALSQALGAVTQTAAAKAIVKGSLSQTVSQSGTSAGKVRVAGTLTQTLPVTVTASATVRVTGALSQTVTTGLAAHAGVLIDGVLTQTLAGVGVSSAAVAKITAALTEQLAAVGVTAESVIPIVGTLTQAVNDVSVVSTATVARPQILDVVLDAVADDVFDVAVQEDVQGTFDVQLSAVADDGLVVAVQGNPEGTYDVALDATVEG